jgi:5-methylthioadenosine/S-adenosylhomocysteine deaminase
MKILIDNISIIPMTRHNYLIEKGFVVIENQIIKELGEGDAPKDNYHKIIDGRNRVVLPGFVNAHTHAAMTLLRGYADDLPLMEWLITKIWPLEAKLSPEDVYWGTMLAIVEMIKSGTTTFADMYFFMDEVAQAVDVSGIRAVIARGMVGTGPGAEKALNESRDLVGKWHQKAGGRISCLLGPHAPYTCPPDYLTRVIKLATDLKVGIHIHLAETKDEIQNIQNLYGKSPVVYLQDLGVLSHQVVAAHCVHLDDQDIKILQESNTGVVHNPESNMKLASGIARVPDMLKAGIPVALGTDGASSNNNLDMLQEMRTCALLHKVKTMDPVVLPAYEALEMATVNGAKVLGLDQQIGKLQPGLRADMIILDLSQAHMIPRYDLIANIVYSAQAGDVNTVIIDGKIVMENRKITTINEKEILDKAKAVAETLVKG